jgi:hypothetical protein
MPRSFPSPDAPATAIAARKEESPANGLIEEANMAELGQKPEIG